MKKSIFIITFTLILTSILSSTTLRRKIPLQTLHNWARGFKVLKYTVRTQNNMIQETRKKHISVTFNVRRNAIIKIMKRKNPKSFKVLAELSAEGLNTRFSPAGIPGASRERISALSECNLRYLAILALYRFKGIEKNQEQKKFIRLGLKAVILEGYSYRNIALACKTLAIHKDALNSKQMDSFNEYFKRQSYKLILNRKFSVLLSMFSATAEFNRKSGISFIDRAIRGGIRGWMLRKAIRIKSKLITSGS